MKLLTSGVFAVLVSLAPAGGAVSLAQVQTEMPAAVAGAKPSTVERIRIRGASLEGNLPHRIGQTQQVFAYRLIARDTVEEKVVELQNTKRDLAAAIIGEENRFVADLGREDLELLLS